MPSFPLDVMVSNVHPWRCVCFAVVASYGVVLPCKANPTAQAHINQASPAAASAASPEPTSAESAEASESTAPGEGDAEASDNDRRAFAANIGELTGQVGSAAKTFTLGGYAEAFYQWNFNKPSNGITAYRGFDNRHNSFTISNAVMDLAWDYKSVIGRVALQVGHTPSTYYASEPVRAGTSTVNASDVNLWKYLQQAYTGYRFNVGNGLLITGGIFLTPIGPEGIPIKDNWNWSRSTLFFGLPYYHTGLRVSYALNKLWSLTIAGYNGYNSVVDNNSEKSVSAQLSYALPNKLALSLIYFGGVERPSRAPEGRAWRHLFDAYATWYATPWLSLMGHVNTGFEPNYFGTSSWAATALYARMRIIPVLFFVLRGDVFHERAASSSFGRASPIFWPANWVGSGTATLEYKPHERVAIRLEFRHDHASSNLYFSGQVQGDGNATPYVGNSRYQQTMTLGMTTWF